MSGLVVVHLAVPEEVGEAVNVRNRVAVEDHAEEVGRALGCAGGHLVAGCPALAALDHEVDGRDGNVGRCSNMTVRAQDTVAPSSTSEMARLTLSGPRKLSVPIWSSSPHLPQLESESKYPITSSSVGILPAIVIETSLDILTSARPMNGSWPQ